MHDPGDDPEAQPATDPVHRGEEDADEQPGPVQVEDLVEHGLRVLAVDEREGKPGQRDQEEDLEPASDQLRCEESCGHAAPKRSGPRPPADRCRKPKLSRKHPGHYSSFRHVGRHPDRQRTPAQPAGRHGGPAPPLPDRDHRSLGLGEVEPRVRYPVRRGPAPVHRVALHLRQAVPRADAQAAGGPARGPGARRGDRAAQPHHVEPLHRRHRHRGVRLPAPPVGAARNAVLPEVRRPGAARYGTVGHRCRRLCGDRPAAGGVSTAGIGPGEPRA